MRGATFYILFLCLFPSSRSLSATLSALSTSSNTFHFDHNKIRQLNIPPPSVTWNIPPANPPIHATPPPPPPPLTPSIQPVKPHPPQVPLTSFISSMNASSAVSSVRLTSESNLTGPPTIPSSATLTAEEPSRTHAPRHFKIAYLIPVFSILGLMWGILAVWIAIGWVTRGPRIRDPHGILAIGGPRYVPAPRDDDDDRSHSGFFQAAEEGRSVRGMMKELEMFQWPAVGDWERDTDPFLDQPVPASTFFTPSRHNQGRKKVMRPKRTPAIRRRSAAPTKPDTIFTTPAPFLPVSASDDEWIDEGEEEKMPWESLRHKSIKRGILERVKKENNWINSLRATISGVSFRSNGPINEYETLHGGADEVGTLITSTDISTLNSMRAGGGSDMLGKRVGRRHERVDSDTRIEDLNLRRFEHAHQRVAPPRLPPLEYDGHLSLSMSRPFTFRTETNQTGVTQSEVGFRILEESPLPTPAGGKRLVDVKDGASEHSSSSWWWGEIEGGQGPSNPDVDRYTPMPVKLSASRTNSRSGSPVKGTPTRERGFSFTGASGAGVLNHAAALPRSPPLITSPCLESQLFFTPTPPAKARVRPGSGSTVKPHRRRPSFKRSEVLSTASDRLAMNINSPRLKARERQARSPTAAAAAVKRKAQTRGRGRHQAPDQESLYSPSAGSGGVLVSTHVVNGDLG